MNLRQELQTLVREHEIKSGLIDTLAQDAFKRIETRCKESAKLGVRAVIQIPIEFQGCKGGYLAHMDLVADAVETLLKNEGVGYHFYKNGYAYTVTVTW